MERALRQLLDSTCLATAGVLCERHLHQQGRHARQLHRRSGARWSGIVSACYAKCALGNDASLAAARHAFQILALPHARLTCPAPALLPLAAHPQVVKNLCEMINKKDKKANVKPFMAKNYLWVFVNCLIENPAFDSQVGAAGRRGAGAVGWQVHGRFAHPGVLAESFLNSSSNPLTGFQTTPLLARRPRTR